MSWTITLKIHLALASAVYIAVFILTTLAMRFGAQTYDAGKTEISTHTDLTTVGRQPQIYKSLDFFFFIM